MTADTTATQTNQAKEPKDLRLRKQHFPKAEDLVFDRKRGFVPVPIILRKLLRHISAPELRVLVYLQTRCSKYFICYPTLEEIAHDLGLNGRKNLRFFADCAAKKWPCRATHCECSSFCGEEGFFLAVFLADLGDLARNHSLSPLTMRVIPSLIRTTLKLMSSPSRLSASFR